MHRTDLARAIYRISHLTGQFKLRSGQISREYFDKYQFESQPVLLAAIAEHLAAYLPIEVEVIAGLEMGGIPLATALSLYTGVPAAFVRKRRRCGDNGWTGRAKRCCPASRRRNGRHGAVCH